MVEQRRGAESRGEQRRVTHTYYIIRSSSRKNKVYKAEEEGCAASRRLNGAGGHTHKHKTATHRLTTQTTQASVTNRTKLETATQTATAALFGKTLQKRRQITNRNRITLLLLTLLFMIFMSQLLPAKRFHEHQKCVNTHTNTLQGKKRKKNSSYKQRSKLSTKRQMDKLAIYFSHCYGTL